jgi:hypothetical protein
MGKRKDTTAGNGEHFTASTRKRVHRTKGIAYAYESYNPVAGLEPDVPIEHAQTRRTNTMNSRRNGGSAMYDNTFKREGRAG